VPVHNRKPYLTGEGCEDNATLLTINSKKNENTHTQSGMYMHFVVITLPYTAGLDKNHNKIKT